MDIQKDTYLNKNLQKEPTDQYFRSKRNLAIFSGLLLASISLNLEENSQSALLPFKLESLDDLAHILFLITLYSLFQFFVVWSAQYESVRMHFLNRLNAFLVSFLAGTAFIAYIYCQFLLDVDLSNFLNYAYFLIPLAIIVLLVFFFLIKPHWINNIVNRIEFNRDKKLFEKLVAEKWKLIFNPISKSSKIIQFSENGTIGKGQNDSEHTWRINNNQLEILNSQEKVFSRFRYNKKENIFEHTNDTDTLSIQNQVIEPSNN